MSESEKGLTSLQDGVIIRTFHAYDRYGMVKMTGKASTREEAIQLAFNTFGQIAISWNYKWID